MKTTIFSFTQKGNALAEQIKVLLKQVDHISRYDEVRLTIRVQNAFLESDNIIFIGAAGIAVRVIAPYIQSKDKDPAVIVIDEKGRHVIPLLSGHLGGANDYAERIADFIGGRPVITTSTDVNAIFAVDVWAKKSDLYIENIENIKHISSALLKGEKIGFSCDYPLDGVLPGFIDRNNSEVGIAVSEQFKTVPFDRTLRLVPKKYIIGVGCRKGIDSELFQSILIQILKEQNIRLDLVCGIASIDLKSKEKAILDFCQKYKLNYFTYSADELSKLNGVFSSSDFVKRAAGIDNVCERSAVMLARNGRLIINKIARNGVTVAVAVKEWRCNFEAGNDRS